MTLKRLFSLGTLLFSLLFLPLFAENTVKDGPVQASLVAEEASVQENHPFWVAIELKMDPQYHTYWKNPGDAGLPIDVKWDLPQGFKAEELNWPAPKQFTVNGISGLGFEDEVVLLAKILPPEHLSSSETVSLKAKVTWLACNDLCIPGEGNVEMDLPIKSEAPEKVQAAASLFEKARLALPKETTVVAAAADENSVNLQLPFAKDSVRDAVFYPEETGIVDLSKKQTLTQTEEGYVLKAPLATPLSETKSLKGIVKMDDQAAIDVVIPAVTHTTAAFTYALFWALIAAFGGGMLLNLMPCVLPVLSLKVLNVVESSGGSFRGRLQQAVSYFGGVLVSFWALTSILLVVKATGQEMGWGFQLQEPIFVGLLAALMFLMALNFFGVFEFGTSFASLDGRQQGKSPFMGAFWSGVLATVVATPCTGPFLGASLGFAMTLPPAGTFGLFTVMAAGMALPFFLLTLFPVFLKIIPKPGQWMVVLKQAMGVLLIVSVLWLVWVFEAETSFTAVMWLLGTFILLTVGALIYGKWGQPIASRVARRVAAIAMIVAMVTTVSAITHSSSIQVEAAQVEHSGSWELFSKARFDELQKEGKPVFIDFTAKWCLLCQANKVVMHSGAVEDAFKKAGVATLKADWTKGDPEITRMLKQLGRTGVPLYVIYSGKQKPTILPETLNQEVIFDALATLQQS